MERIALGCDGRVIDRFPTAPTEVCVGVLLAGSYEVPGVRVEAFDELAEP